MRASNLFIHTTREQPVEAELVSHGLMLRAGMLRQIASGLFSWLPLGLRSVRKVEQIVREEMNRANAAEIVMPAVQPAELWQESGRWQIYGKELLRLQDRHQRDYCIGPTHEEVVTDIVRGNISSWRQLPVNLYQIQTKFRDEIRPRFGVMRAREFIMKDAYSFDIDNEGAQRSYETMRKAYIRIFDRIGLNYRIAEADVGAIGGSASEEFLVLADTGEVAIAYTDSGYAANLEHVSCARPQEPSARAEPSEKLEEFETPGVATIEQLAQFMKNSVPIERNIKTMIVAGENGTAAVLLRGNDELNLAKASKVSAIGFGAALADPEEAQKAIGASFGSLGPVNMPLPVVADYGLLGVSDFVCGANRDGYHFRGVNFGRDLAEPEFADLRMARAGDSAPDGSTLKLRRGIEVGQIFNLGTKYSQAMGAQVEGPDNTLRPVVMGCYGIGITRIIAAAIEQNYDDAGIVFPLAIAPFAAAILPLGRDEKVHAQAAKLHDELAELGIDVLLDDRGMRAGAAFADLDLLGIPHRLVISERTLAKGEIEHKVRSGGKIEFLPVDSAAKHISEIAAGS